MPSGAESGCSDDAAEPDVLRALALLVSIAAGVALGLAGTAYALRGDPPFGAVHGGAWTGWPAAGTPDADPYLRAVAARDGRVALAAAAGLRLIARTDDAGHPLIGRCTYTVGGAFPASEDWTLSVLDADGRPRVSPDPRAGFTSSEVVRGSAGAGVVTVARQARPGNWLPTRGDGAFVLMLSLYDTPLTSALVGGSPVPELPAITAEACP